MNALGTLPIEEEIDDTGANIEAFVCMLEELRDLEGSERDEALVGFASSPFFSACGFLLLGWQGELHREAFDRLNAALAIESPGKRWWDADHNTGRETIERLLGCTTAAGYASYPFRTVWTDEDEPWIAGAVGGPPVFSNEYLYWNHLRIRHVILWNPKTNETRIDGEAPSQTSVVLPQVSPGEIKIYADTRRFFTDWAKGRALFAAKFAKEFPECQDGRLPGALIVGDHGKARWPVHYADTLIAGPGITQPALRDMVLRAANLPVIAGGEGGRG